MFFLNVINHITRSASVVKGAMDPEPCPAKNPRGGGSISISSTSIGIGISIGSSISRVDFFHGSGILEVFREDKPVHSNGNTTFVVVGLIARMAWTGKVVINHPSFRFHRGGLPS